MKNRILIRVDANAKIGWGHFYRCLALAQMLVTDFDISFAMAAPLPQAEVLLEQQKLSLIPLPDQPYTTPDDKGDKELNFDLEKAVETFDFVILDGYWFGPKYQQALRQMPVKVGIVEDAGQGQYWADLIINHVPDLSAKNYQTDTPDTQFALGSDFALLRPGFLRIAREQRLIKEKRTTLICFGGSDQFDYTRKAYEAISEAYYNMRFIIITGPSYVHTAQLEYSIGDSSLVSLKSNLDEEEMLQAMLEADLAVVPSSGILYETLAAGNAVVTVQCAENQKRFHEAFTKNAQVNSAGDFSKNEIHKAFDTSMQYEGEKSRVIDGESGERLTAIIKNLLASHD